MTKHLSRRLVEIEEHRDKVQLSETFTKGIQYHLPLRSEASQDQHSFPPNRVENVSDLLIVEHQINELGYFQVIDRYRRLVFGGNDQV